MPADSATAPERPLEVDGRLQQALREPGRDLAPVARSPDGLVEAAVLERQDRWVEGGPWHPEDLLHQPVQRRLWRDSVDATATAAANRRGEEAP